jgi:glutaredoxin 3
VKEYLSRKGVEFDDRDVSQDREALMELLDTHRSNMTPTIVIDGEVIIGFDRDRIDALLSG